MRYLIAAICLCALGVPAASALPASGPHGLSMSAADPMLVQASHRSGKGSKRGGGKSSRHGGLGGIHPLVGSGDY